MEIGGVDMRRRGMEWLSFSVVVVLTAPRPGGADKNTGSRDSAVDCISQPGSRAGFGV